MLFDSHAHYLDERFDVDRDALLASLPQKGVGRVLCASVTLENSRENLALAERWPELYAAVGVYPHDCGDLELPDLEALRELAKHPKARAIGEIGLDYHYDTVSREKQLRFYRRQLELSKEVGLPVIIHDREAHQDCLDLIREVKPVGGVFHCYTGSAEFAREVLDQGFYISFSGSVTFKNAVNLAKAAQYVPLDRLLVETDCPYLAPVPYRGKRNDSTLMEYTARKLAELKGVSYETIVQATWENASRLFQI